MDTYRNLLPPEFRQQLLISLRMRQWCKIWIATVLVLLGGGLHKYSKSHALQVRSDMLNLQAVPILETKQANAALAKQLADLTENIALIEGVNDAGHHLALIGVISQSAQRTGTTIQVQSCSFQEIIPTPATSKKQKTKKNRIAGEDNEHHNTIEVELRGLSVDESTIARFIRILKTIETFTHVELKTVRGVEVSNQRLRTYQIRCAL